jgi:hypothetical protein
MIRRALIATVAALVATRSAPARAGPVETLREFGGWLESRGLQAIGTRVGTGEESSIVIEDGVAAGAQGEAKDYTF